MAVFDAHRPPELSVVQDCVHCGFCLPTCPTYVLWGEEADSPRGRIVLVDRGLRSDDRLSPEMVSHFDRCLGCMACVTACPSGVRYDRLIERVRPQVQRHYQRSGFERALRWLLFETLPHPKRLRALAPLLAAGRKLGAERLHERVSSLTKVAPRTPLRRALHAALPERTAPRGEQRGRVALLLGCVQRVFYPEVNRATIGALAAEGFEVLAPRAAGCCGALELHAGEEQSALGRARAIVDAFGSLGAIDHIVVNAAGCGAAMKEYGELLGTPQARAFSGRVRDICEVLGSVAPRAPRGPLSLRVAYHDACHLAHAQRIRAQPRALLHAIPELELLEVGVEPEVCCGSAGVYNLLQPRAAAALGARKAAHLLATGADAIAAGNPGCAAQLDMHLRELGRPLPIYHPVELVWRSIAAGSRTPASS
ncbi:MAG: heterodisulfide reductase-related iron-sulfur binding cluster [Solirubrobacteraceae bacterium]